MFMIGWRDSTTLKDVIHVDNKVPLLVNMILWGIMSHAESFLPSLMLDSRLGGRRLRLVSGQN